MSNSKVCESYKIPEWAEVPQHNFTLDVLKNGVIIKNIDLTTQDHYILGRKEPMCDIVLEHPSISRQHAIIQFGKNDTVALIDLGSTHGTKVNKQSIPKNKFHTLHVGDVIKFAESTRLYVLNGPEELKPEEYDSENLRKFRAEAKEREKQRLKEFEELKKKGLEDEEARRELTRIKKSLTGTDEDVLKNLSKYKKVYHIVDEGEEEEEEIEGSDNSKSSSKDKVNQDLLSKQQQELYQRLEQLEKRKGKIEERIAKLNKQSEFGFEDISDRQKRSIEKDEKMLETLQEQISKVQEEIEKLNDEEKTTQKDEISSEYYNDEFDDEDEYFDRTLKEKKKKQKMNENKEILNEKTISIKLKDLNKEIMTIKRKIKEIDLEEQIAVNTIDNNNNSDKSNSFDPLDAYMSNSVSKLHQNEKKKLENQLNEIVKEQDKYYKMLKVIISTVDFSNSGDNNKSDDEIIPKEVLKETEKLKENLNNPNFMSIMSGGNDSNNNKNNKNSFKMKPPLPPLPSISSSQSAKQSQHHQQPKATSFKMKMPPPAFNESDLNKDGTNNGNSVKLMPPPPSIPKSNKSTSKTTSTTKSNATKRLVNPVLQELSEKEQEKEESEKKKKKIAIDEEDWKPPEGQTGDGKTALNDLLGY